jgi:hypothetical protein
MVLAPGLLGVNGIIYALLIVACIGQAINNFLSKGDKKAPALGRGEAAIRAVDRAC